jgi:hypothetical protein
MKKNFFILFLALFSCSKSEVLVLNERLETKADTTVYTPRQKPEVADTVKLSDVPINFDVTVEDWEEEY